MADFCPTCGAPVVEVEGNTVFTPGSVRGDIDFKNAELLEAVHNLVSRAEALAQATKDASAFDEASMVKVAATNVRRLLTSD